MLLLSMVRNQVLLCFRQNANALNKLCKIKFRYFTTHLAISQQHEYQDFFEYGVYVF